MAWFATGVISANRDLTEVERDSSNGRAVRLLIVEDEIDLADTLAEGLRREGYLVDVARDGASALAAASAADIDVIVLDRDLPVIGGDAVCRTLVSQQYPARILMLTAAGTLGDRVSGFDLGADDYLAKPFAYLELLARIRALGRRGHLPRSSAVLEFAGVRLDTSRRIAERNGSPVRLTMKEFGVLESLMSAGGGYLSSEELLEDVWDEPNERTRGVVKIVIHTLRRKLGSPDVIQSAPKYGYRMGVSR
jgi:DNA-binding response OmpR family regulator